MRRVGMISKAFWSDQQLQAQPQETDRDGNPKGVTRIPKSEMHSQVKSVRWLVIISSQNDHKDLNHNAFFSQINSSCKEHFGRLNRRKDSPQHLLKESLIEASKE